MLKKSNNDMKKFIGLNLLMKKSRKIALYFPYRSIYNRLSISICLFIRFI